MQWWRNLRCSLGYHYWREYTAAEKKKADPRDDGFCTNCLITGHIDWY